MARTFKYVGGSDAVEIPATGQVVERGHQVVIEDPEVSKGLDGQADWEPVVPKKRAAKKATAKKAAPTTPEPAPAEPTDTPAED